MAVDVDPPVYGGAMCTNGSCDWLGDDPRVERCPVCGSWNRFWMTDQVDLIPPQVMEAHRISGTPLVALPPGQED